MTEAATYNTGSASHLGANEFNLDGYFVYDYSQKHIPLPVISYMTISDTVDKSTPTELNGKWAMNVLHEYLNPSFITKEELNRETMQSLIEGAFQKVNQRLIQECRNRNLDEAYKLSMTAILTSAGYAYIGHTGDCRAYLHRHMKLFDITPYQTQEDKPDPNTAAPALFQVQEMTFTESTGDNLEPKLIEENQITVKGEYLGESNEVRFGYNVIEIIPGDTLILCSDGFYTNVSLDETLENLNSTSNLERIANQLIRLAFSRDAGDNATFLSWKYGIPGIVGTEFETGAGRKVPKTMGERAFDALIFALLGVVLCGILGIGFAFGWKIADTIQKPKEEKTQTAAKSQADENKNTDETEEQNVVVEVDPNVPVTKVAVIEGSGVRMRATPSTQGNVIGLLSDGQEVTVLEEVAGNDGKKWSKVKGVVRNRGKDIESEGYVSNDYLKEPGKAKETPSSTGTIPSSTPQGTTPN